MIVFSLSCKSNIDLDKGIELYNKNNWDESVSYLIKSLGKNPDNVKSRLMLAKALISASNYHYQLGNKFKQKGNLRMALIEYSRSIENNPENNRARREKYILMKRLREADKKKQILLKKSDLKEDGVLNKSLSDKIERNVFSLDFPSVDLKHLLRVISKTTNVSFLFDEGFKTKKIRAIEKDISVMQLLEKIVLQTKIFYKIINDNTVLIIPDTPLKRKQYEELAMKTFFLSNSEPEELAKILKVMTGIKNITVNKQLSAIIVKAPFNKLKLAEKIIDINDKSKGEVLIDLEVIEVNRKRVKEYGIELNNYRITQSYSGGRTDENFGSVMNLNNLPLTGASDFILSLPSIHYKLLKSDQDSKIKAKPHIRIIDGEKIDLSLGDKVPIPTTTFVPQYGGSTVNNQPITSYKLEDIGINITIEPKIHLNGWITIKLEFELTFISSPGDIQKGTPPTIGNRSVNTQIRLRDNETSILAGLLRDTERRSLNGFPVISKIPILKDLFSGNSRNIEQTDIILTLTPRIIRYPEINDSDKEIIWAGTAADPGLKNSPPKLKQSLEFNKRYQENKNEKSKIDNSGLSPEKKTENLKIQKDKKRDEKQPVSTAEIGFDIPPKKIDSGSVFPVNLFLKNLNKKKRIRVLKCELDFDPDTVEINKIEVSKLQGRKRIAGNLMKRFDNKTGKLNLNISLNDIKKFDNTNIVTIYFLAKKTGTTVLKCSKVDLYDKKLNKIKTKAGKIDIKIEN